MVFTIPIRTGFLCIRIKLATYLQGQCLGRCNWYYLVSLLNNLTNTKSRNLIFILSTTCLCYKIKQIKYSLNKHVLFRTSRHVLLHHRLWFRCTAIVDRLYSTTNGKRQLGEINNELMVHTQPYHGNKPLQFSENHN